VTTNANPATGDGGARQISKNQDDAAGSALNRRPTQAHKSWRDVLPVHPAADLFPLMSPDELRELGENIEKNGLKIPVILWSENTFAPVQLLDGRNRLDAMEAAGIPFRMKRSRATGATHLLVDGCFETTSLLVIDVDPFDYVLSANIHRRHLTAEQKREIIAKVLKAKPEASNRQIAKQVKADDKTVGNVWRELEATAEIPQLDKTTGADGKARPTKKTQSHRATDESDDEPFIDNPDARELAKRRAQFLKDAGAALATGQGYDGPIDAHVIKVAIAIRDTWAELVRKLKAGDAA
jgi:hypothetical protein